MEESRLLVRQVVTAFKSAAPGRGKDHHMSDDPQVNEKTTEDEEPDVEAHRKTSRLNEDADDGGDDGPDVEGHIKRS